MGPDERGTGSHPVEEIPFYVGGGLDPAGRERVRAHLEGCFACREEAAFWTQVAQAVRSEDAALPVPGLHLPEVRRRSLQTRWLIGRLGQVGQLLWAQARVLDRRVWGASTLLLGMGFLVIVFGSREHGATWISAVAPLVAAGGIALVEHPRRDPTWELILATPTSPGTLLLARAAILFACDVAIALAVTAATGPETWTLLGSVVMGWLAPMTLLSSLALFLSLLVGPEAAVTSSLVLWVAARIPAEARAFSGQEFWVVISRSIAFVAQGPWVWVASGLLVAGALFLSSRESLRATGTQG